MARFILSAFADEANVQLEKQIDALKRNNIQFIELRGVNGKNVITLNNEEIKDLKTKLGSNGIKVWSIGSPIGKIKITDSFTKHLDDFKRTIEIAQKLDCGNIRMFSFFMPQVENPSVYRDEVMQRMTVFLETAEGSGVDCCHENEKDIYGDNLERSLDLFETLGPRLKGIFDPANYIQCGVETLEAFKKLNKYIKYLHVKDARFADKKVVPSGNGNGNIEDIINILNKRNSDMILSVEPHLAVFKGFSDLGDNTVLGSDEFVYKTNDEAFDAACDAIKKILEKVEK